MYSYKLNNSYTVYVNYTYLNECIKASKEWSKYSSKKPSTKPANKERPLFPPLSVNTMLKHKTFGFGKVVSTDKNGIMQVAFGSKTVRFLYPDAVKQGFLVIAQ